jgi:hypothetical protein
MSAFAEARAAMRDDPNLQEEATELLGSQGKRARTETACQWPAPLAPEAWYGLPGEIVRTIEPHSEADPAALLIQLLVAFGNLVGRGPHFLTEQTEQRTNLFTVVVGRTAKARKGTSWGQIRALLLNVDPDCERRIHGGAGSGEGIIWGVRDPILKGEKLDDERVSDKRMVLVESEFAQILAVVERTGSTIAEVLKRAWDGEPLQILTKNSPVRSTGAHVSMIGHITEAELVRRLDHTEIANGFANRIIFCCAKRSKELPEGGSLDWQQHPDLVDKLRAVIESAKNIDLMKRDPEARELWRQRYHDLSEGQPGLLGAVTHRGEAQVVRLSMLYALLDRTSVISREHLEAALAVWKYSEDSCRHIFGDSLGDPTADEILRALRATPEGLTRTDIRNLFSRHGQKNDIVRALGNLLREGRAEFVPEPTGGRDAERWFLRRPNTTQNVFALPAPLGA